MDNIKINYKIYNNFIIDRLITITLNYIQILDEYYIDDEIITTDNKRIIINSDIYHEFLTKIRNIKEEKILGCASNSVVISYDNIVRDLYFNSIKDLISEILSFN